MKQSISNEKGCKQYSFAKCPLFVITLTVFITLTHSTLVILQHLRFSQRCCWVYSALIFYECVKSSSTCFGRSCKFPLKALSWSPKVPRGQHLLVSGAHDSLRLAFNLTSNSLCSIVYLTDDVNSVPSSSTRTHTQSRTVITRHVGGFHLIL
jgi:hypothetical protein